MKRIFITVIFCALFTHPQVFAGDDSVGAHIARTLYIMFKLPYTNCAANENEYQQKTIVYNGMHLTGFKSKSSGWAGFFKSLSQDDLPDDVLKHIKISYAGCTIEHVVMYFDSNAEISYFAEIKTNSKCIFLKIQPSGQTKIFSCMSEQALNN